MVYWQLSHRIKWSLFFAIITLQITKKINSESLGDLYSLVYQIFGKKKKREMTKLEAKEELNDNKREILARMDEYSFRRDVCL